MRLCGPGRNRNRYKNSTTAQITEAIGVIQRDKCACRESARVPFSFAGPSPRFGSRLPQGLPTGQFAGLGEAPRRRWLVGNSRAIFLRSNVAFEDADLPEREHSG